MREALAQHVQQPVKLTGLGVGGGFTVVSRLHQLAVHVPLHVVDRMLAQQPAHAFHKIIKSLRNVEVEHQLMTPGRLGIARQRQHPVRMRAIQIGVRVDHLRLNPDAKLHAEPFDVVNHRRQAIRIFFLIQIPVAQRGVVVIAAFEPAVVNNKALHAQRGGLVGHPHDVIRIVVEVDPLPGIEVYRTRFIFREADDVVAQVAMERLAHAVQAPRGVAGIQARCPERIALFYRHFPRQVERFGLNITATVGFRFRAQAMVPAPAQMHAPDVTLHFAERWRTGYQCRKVFVGGFTPAVFNHNAVVLKVYAVRLELSDPASVEGHHLPGALGHRQRDGKAVNLPGTCFQVR